MGIKFNPVDVFFHCLDLKVLSKSHRRDTADVKLVFPKHWLSLCKYIYIYLYVYKYLKEISIHDMKIFISLYRYRLKHALAAQECFMLPDLKP